MSASLLFAISTTVGAIATLAGLIFGAIKVLPEYRKLRAEAKKTESDTSLAGEERDDEHWQAIVRTQVDVIVTPLRQEVTELRAEVANLRLEVETIRTRYWRAISFVRTLLTILNRHNIPDVPLPPIEIAADI